MMVVDLCCSITSSQCILPLPQDHATRDFRQVHRSSSRLSQFEVVPRKTMSSIISSKGKRLLILYGSQTGCSKEVAELLGRMGKRRLFECETLALDDYPLARLPTEHLVFFVVATTGDGDPPDNMVRFWEIYKAKKLAQYCFV